MSPKRRRRLIAIGAVVATVGVTWAVLRKTKPTTKQTKLPPSGDTKLDELQHKLEARGVRDFTALELTAAGGGKHIPVPDQYLDNFLRVAQLAQRIRDDYGKPIVISSGYRPWDDPGGNHYEAAAIDFDLPSGKKTQAEERALRLIVARHWQKDSDFHGMGFYHAPTGRIHIEVRRPGGKGKRYWFADEVEPILEELQATS